MNLILYAILGLLLSFLSAELYSNGLMLGRTNGPDAFADLCIGVALLILAAAAFVGAVLMLRQVWLACM